MKTVDEVWDELFEYWQKNEPNFNGCKGATEEEIAKVEEELNMPLPLSLKQSLKRCNSYPNDWEKVKKSSCLYLGEGGSVHNAEKIIEVQDNMYTFRCGFPCKNLYGNITSPKEGWDKAWIPIYSYNCDVFFCIDAREIDGVVQEKIIYVDVEYGILAVVANSYQEFLNMVLDVILKKGYYGAEDLEDIMLSYGVTNCD